MSRAGPRAGPRDLLGVFVCCYAPTVTVATSERTSCHFLVDPPPPWTQPPTWHPPGIIGTCKRWTGWYTLDTTWFTHLPATLVHENTKHGPLMGATNSCVYPYCNNGYSTATSPKSCNPTVWLAAGVCTPDALMQLVSFLSFPR